MSAPPRFALDLETVATVDDPDFDNPQHWLPFASALGYQESHDSEPEVEVIFRSSPTIECEAMMLEEMFEWFAQRHPGGRADVEMLTYNGVSYDYPILKHRCNEISSQTDKQPSERLYLLDQATEHIDLIQRLRDRTGRWISLDDALSMHDIHAASPKWNGEPVSGSDMPRMGERIMSDDECEDLRTAVERYAASDVSPLFKLRHQLDCQRQHSAAER